MAFLRSSQHLCATRHVALARGSAGGLAFGSKTANLGDDTSVSTGQIESETVSKTDVKRGWHARRRCACRVLRPPWCLSKGMGRRRFSGPTRRNIARRSQEADEYGRRFRHKNREHYRSGEALRLQLSHSRSRLRPTYGKASLPAA